MIWRIQPSTIRIAGILALAVGAVVVAASMQSNSTIGRHDVYRNVEDGFEVALPAGWTRRQLTLQDGRRIDVFASPNESVDQASCSIGSSDNEAWSGKTQDAINAEIAGGALDQTLEPLLGTVGAPPKLVTSKHVSQHGMTAVVAVFTQEVTVSGQSANMRTKLFVSASPGRVRYIHCVVFEEKFELVDAQFDLLIGSYRAI